MSTSDWRLRLKLAIMEKNEKVTELSERLGFSRDYISRMVNNKDSRPVMDNVRRICDEIGVSFTAIYTGDSTSQNRDAIIGDIAKMDDQELAALKSFMDARGYK